MIGSLRGHLLERSTSGEVLIECAGVGYRVQLSPSDVARLHESDGEVFIHTYHHIREDTQVLYGFLSKEERITFEALISARGVGPSLGLAILSVHSPGALHAVIADDDLDSLCLVPGVGRKTAQRLLIELKGALDLPDLPANFVPGSDGGVATGVRSDVRDALLELGYGAEEIRSVLADLDVGDDSSAGLKAALQRLASVR